MPCFFELLREEEHPAVRIVLGHFVFVYVQHRYLSALEAASVEQNIEPFAEYLAGIDGCPCFGQDSGSSTRYRKMI